MENGGSSKKISRQLKSKTFNILKYKLTVSSHTYSQEDDATQGTPGKPFYSDIKKMQTKWIIDQRKVKRMSSTNQPNRWHAITKNTKRQKEGKSPIRSKSNAKQDE